MIRQKCEKMQECALYKGGLFKQLQIESGTIRSIALLGVNTNNGAKFFMKSYLDNLCFDFARNCEKLNISFLFHAMSNDTECGNLEFSN